MASETDRFQKISKLLAALDELHEKEAELLRELRTITAGNEGIGEQLKRLYTALSGLWSLRYHTGYVFTFTRDAPALKRLLRSMPPEDIIERFAVYVRSNDPFYERTRHSLAAFVQTVNQHIPVMMATSTAPPPADCHHAPPCLNDADHTARHLEDMRHGH